MLILLLATCQQTQTALGAAANALDTDLTKDLDALIERTEREHGDEPNIEIVLVGSDSIETVHRTHGNYFGEDRRLPFRELVS